MTPSPSVEPISAPASSAVAVRVLLVEDNFTDAFLFGHAASALDGVYFDVSQVTRLSDVKDRLRSAQPDLVITDLGLPDSQGMATYRAVRALAPHLPVIVLTGLDDERTGLRALREGAQDYLVKGELTPRAVARAARYAMDRKHHEDRLRQAQKLEAVGRLTTTVAHDFNNLLGVVRGNLDLLMSSDDMDDARLHGTDALEAVERATELTRQLMSLARQGTSRPKALDVNRIVRNFSRLLRRFLGNDIELVLELAESLPPVLADAAMIEQILLNLCVNARDSMESGGKLRIWTSTASVDSATTRTHPDAYPGIFVRVSVSDTGTGMSEEVLSRIFEPFFTTKSPGKGTGVGLSAVRDAVRAHAGWLAVTSELDHGTTFDIHIPAMLDGPTSSGLR